MPKLVFFRNIDVLMQSLCFSPFITFDNVRSSFTKRQDMFPVILALCFVLKIFRCSEHYAPKYTILIVLFLIFKDSTACILLLRVPTGKVYKIERIQLKPTWESKMHLFLQE